MPRAAPPAGWLAAALDPPRAGGPPPVGGRLRELAEDFEVEERLGFDPDGGAAHLMLRVRKTDANTLHVARSLARFAGLRPFEVGFAGLKDRRAVATQWFSVPSKRPPADWLQLDAAGFAVLEAQPHSRKLRRGTLAGNRFRIVVRGLEGNRQALATRLGRVAAEGVPNYFGPQRFGREAANLAAVAAWLGGGELPRDREQRGFLFSSARALAFNCVLAGRVTAHNWDRLLPGEVVNLDGSASVFAAPEIDAALEARCRSGDVHPTGPLPGRGGVEASAAAGELEAGALVALGDLVVRLAGAGVDAARRPLRLPVKGLEWQVEGDTLNLSFELGRGAFATAVVRELVAFDAGAVPALPD